MFIHRSMLYHAGLESEAKVFAPLRQNTDTVLDIVRRVLQENTSNM